MRRANATGMLGLVAVTLIVAAATSLRAEEGATFAAMQIAYAREVIAGTQYLAFASRAELEAQPAAACLFRVVARAESVHAANHAAVIERLGGKPACRPMDVVVQETAENLKTSIEVELQERSLVYRRFADYARSEYLYEALASANYARSAEATHERAFRAALWRLERERTMQYELALASLEPPMLPIRQEPGPPYYFVCLGDGSVFTEPTGRCPNCGTSGDWIVDLSCPF